MRFVKRSAAAAAAIISILAAAPAFAVEPQDVVRALYTEPSLSFGPDRLSDYFASDLDGAMTLRDVPVGFDYRYGADDQQVSAVELVTDVDHDQARVVAVFKIRGRANSVDWTLCRRPDGDWRIADAHSNTGPQEWDLRQILRLPTQSVSC